MTRVIVVTSQDGDRCPQSQREARPLAEAVDARDPPARRAVRARQCPAASQPHGTSRSGQVSNVPCPCRSTGGSCVQPASHKYGLHDGFHAPDTHRVVGLPGHPDAGHGPARVQRNVVQGRPPEHATARQRSLASLAACPGQDVRVRRVSQAQASRLSAGAEPSRQGYPLAAPPIPRSTPPPSRPWLLRRPALSVTRRSREPLFHKGQRVDLPDHPLQGEPGLRKPARRDRAPRRPARPAPMPR